MPLIPADPDPVAAAFRAVADHLAATAPDVAVHTADLAHAESPWFLVFEYENDAAIVIGFRAGGGLGNWHDWDEASPAARLATLSHLPVLLDRIRSAAAVAARLSRPESIAAVCEKVRVALAIGSGAESVTPTEAR